MVTPDKTILSIGEVCGFDFVQPAAGKKSIYFIYLLVFI